MKLPTVCYTPVKPRQQYLLTFAINVRLNYSLNQSLLLCFQSSGTSNQLKETTAYNNNDTVTVGWDREKNENVKPRW